MKSGLDACLFFPTKKNDNNPSYGKGCRSLDTAALLLNVKLLNIPIHIMEYYKGLAPDGKVFPHMSLGQVNVGLKRIARNCGINRKLSYHMARYTFASQICLSQGVPIESVSRMLGHKHIETTQRYARLNNEKIGNDMQQLSARLATKFNF